MSVESRRDGARPRSAGGGGSVKRQATSIPSRHHATSIGDVASHRSTTIAMDTLVTVEIVTAPAADQKPAAIVPTPPGVQVPATLLTAPPGDEVPAAVVSAPPDDQAQVAIARALGWFSVVERACSRFDPASELRQLLGRVGEPVAVSSVLFESVRFALALADLTDGAFDPTLGHLLEASGFDLNYITGERVRTPVASTGTGRAEVVLDPLRQTITLRRPVALDLGAVAKGLALDLAARELAPYGSFCVEAGGDLFAGGRRARRRPWRIGVQDPNRPEAIAHRIEVVDSAVCTSGGYERRTADGTQHHLIDPRTGRGATALASVTVVAPSAMAADGLATAAFVLGLDRGRRLLEQQGVGGIFISPAGEIHTTRDVRPVTR